MNAVFDSVDRLTAKHDDVLTIVEDLVGEKRTDFKLCGRLGREIQMRKIAERTSKQASPWTQLQIKRLNQLANRPDEVVDLGRRKKVKVKGK